MMATPRKPAGLPESTIREILRLSAQGKSDRDIPALLLGGVNRYRVQRVLIEAKAKQAAEGRPATVIPVARAHQNAHARPLLECHIIALVESVRQIDLIEPIVVRRLGDDFEIIAGGHRTAAFQRLKRETIPAIILDVDDLTAELMLIDENLIRKNLSPAEESIALRRRKEIYEELHPKTKHGGDRKSDEAKSSGIIGHLIADKPVDNVSRETPQTPSPPANPAPMTAAPRPERFTAATAEATGISERTIRKAVSRAAAIGDSELKQVVGTSLDKTEELNALAKVSEAKRKELITRAVAGETVTAKPVVKQEIRAAKEKELAKKQQAFPDKKFGVILADPEWRFEPWSRETGMDRAADNHYSTSPTEIIKARPVETIAAPDCVLFLWATAPMLPQVLEVMKAWGFAYKSHAVWFKERSGDARGPGYWFTNEHELLLVGTKGHVPAPAPGHNWRSVFKALVRRHSQKPDIGYEMIEAYFPNLPKIELNARSGRLGWATWGAEAPAEAAE
jgi:N6-adenosine-specific RNA methylase IME4